MMDWSLIFLLGASVFIADSLGAFYFCLQDAKAHPGEWRYGIRVGTTDQRLMSRALGYIDAEFRMVDEETRLVVR